MSRDGLGAIQLLMFEVFQKWLPRGIGCRPKCTELTRTILEVAGESETLAPPSISRTHPAADPGQRSDYTAGLSSLLRHTDNRQKGTGQLAAPRPVKDLFRGICNFR